MVTVNRKETFLCDIKKVWRIVTALEEYGWRSDLEEIRCLNDRQFVERTKEGCETTFTVTCCEPCHRWEFDMENDVMRGHWTGLFTEEDGKATIDFTEKVSVKKLFMKPFAGIFLRRQQAAYFADLRKALAE